MNYDQKNDIKPEVYDAACESKAANSMTDRVMQIREATEIALQKARRIEGHLFGQENGASEKPTKPSECLIDDIDEIIRLIFETNDVLTKVAASVGCC